MSSLIKKYSQIYSYIVYRISYVAWSVQLRREKQNTETENQSKFVLRIVFSQLLGLGKQRCLAPLFPYNIFLFLLNMIIVPITPIKKPIGQAKIGMKIILIAKTKTATRK